MRRLPSLPSPCVLTLCLLSCVVSVLVVGERKALLLTSVIHASSAIFCELCARRRSVCVWGAIFLFIAVASPPAAPASPRSPPPFSTHSHTFTAVSRPLVDHLLHLSLASYEGDGVCGVGTDGLKGEKRGRKKHQGGIFCSCLGFPPLSFSLMHASSVSASSRIHPLLVFLHGWKGRGDLPRGSPPPLPLPFLPAHSPGRSVALMCTCVCDPLFGCI